LDRVVETSAMGWERGSYYTRSRKVNGRVVREYVGSGWIADMAAQLDAIERDEREAEARHRRAVRAEVHELTETLDALSARCDLLTRAALVAAGFRQHHRGEWRRRRGDKSETDSSADPGPADFAVGVGRDHHRPEGG
jgi:hypothetical protein